MSAITIQPVVTKKDSERFVKFQWEIYKDIPEWVPPLLMDRRKLMDKVKNPFYTHARAEFWLAMRDGKIVGRIGAIVNDNHNKEHNENVGFFGFFAVCASALGCHTAPSMAIPPRNAIAPRSCLS